ncbi:MAG: hypothetical protein Q4G30_05850 [Actinomycetaceae bacterium]|nr:hypothetical protein [Actinomycetaceae bacterium]
MKRLVATIIVVAACLAGCSGGKGADDASPSGTQSPKSPTPLPTLSAPAAPQGTVNSRDGAFNVTIPQGWYSLIDLIQGQPQLQVAVGEGESEANGEFLENVVIDASQSISTPEVLETTLKEAYPGFAEFKVLDPPNIPDANVLFVSFKESSHGEPFRHYLCFVSGWGRAYAVKQDIPISIEEDTRIRLEELVKTWTWLPGVTGQEAA